MRDEITAGEKRTITYSPFACTFYEIHSVQTSLLAGAVLRYFNMSDSTASNLINYSLIWNSKYRFSGQLQKPNNIFCALITTAADRSQRGDEGQITH